MRYTLSTFYKSGEWEGLLQVLKLERVNDRGEIICAHCGKPITKAYDCIGHHTIYLTEANVNDRSISLNPDLIQLVHHRCHNKIHDKFGYKVRQVFVVYGPPLSGKTSYVDSVREDGDLIVDVDSLWESVSGCRRYVKPGRLTDIVVGRNGLRDCLIDMVKMRRGKWNNAYVIGGYPFAAERERLLTNLGAREVFIDTPKKECVERLLCCEDARDKNEWMKYINDWFEKYSPGAPPG